MDVEVEEGPEVRKAPLGVCLLHQGRTKLGLAHERLTRRGRLEVSERGSWAWAWSLASQASWGSLGLSTTRLAAG